MNITIDGADLTGITLEGVRVAYGREDTTQQPAPAYATLTLLDLTETRSTLDLINQRIILSHLDSTIFTGTISDVQTDVADIGQGHHIFTHQLTATGALARLTGRTTSATYPAALDGARVLAILRDGLAAQWQEQAPSLVWTDASDTWESLLPTLDLVDAGGSVIAAYTDGITSPLDLAASAASDAGGILYDTPSGLIGYADTYRRAADVNTNGYLTIDASILDGTQLRATTRLADIINATTVEYSTGSATSTDPSSMYTYGVQSTTITTQLVTATAAQARADLITATRARPRQYLDAVRIGLHLLPDSDALPLLALYQGRPIRLENLPPVLGATGTILQGFIEGWAWEANYGEVWLTLQISEASLSLTSTRWGDYAPATTWTTTTPTLHYVDIG